MWLPAGLHSWEEGFEASRVLRCSLHRELRSAAMLGVHSAGVWPEIGREVEDLHQ